MAERALDQLYESLGWAPEARIYSYGRSDLFTVEFQGQARPTPRAQVIAFAALASQHAVHLVIDMRHRGRNATDLALHDELQAQGIDVAIEE
jgi:hypothetical protein